MLHRKSSPPKRLVLPAALAVTAFTLPAWALAEPAGVQSLIEAGRFAEAEKLLADQIPNREAPVTSEAAIQLEILRRTRHDFPLASDELLRQIKESVPDATREDVDRWREAGDLQFRMIDGEIRYFREAASNLFRFNKEAAKRRGASTPPKFDLTAHARELVTLSEGTSEVEIFPVKHRIAYSLTVNKNHPRVKRGAVVRAWLPYPQEYRTQRKVRLITSEPRDGEIARNGAPHRTIYFEQTLGDDPKPPRFRVELEYETAAYCPKLDPTRVEPYDTKHEQYQLYTAERSPHIVFTPEVKRHAAEIVGDESNPLEKARLIFRWVSQNIPWCSEMEYSIIPNISVKGLTARRGDCGVKGMTFITLCRAAGVPARWQSGWQARPGDWNMHDWAEFYVKPWGWLPCDASYGVRDDPDPRVQDFFCGRIDPYRLIVNLDYGRPLQPPKTSFRSEPNDFQRGEIEIDGHNLYFDEWDWSFEVTTTPLPSPTASASTAQDSRP
jgi:hypothetical protein